MPVSLSRRLNTPVQLLELEGVIVGPVSAEGGGAFADVVAVPPAGPGWVQKHVGGVRYDDLVIACGAGMAPALYNWVRNTLNGQPLRKSGYLIQLDHDGAERSRLQFVDALIDKVVLPGLDVSSKTPLNMSLLLAPETTQWLPGSGAVIGADQVWKSNKQWLSSNFRLAIADFDCNNVIEIAPLTITVGPLESALAETGAGSESAVRLEAGNLIITLPEINADSFRYWHEEFVVMGKSGSDKEKTGSIQLLDANLADALLVLGLEGLGIVRFDRIAPEGAGHVLVRVEMYCNRITLDPGALAIASGVGASKVLAVESPSRLGPRGLSGVGRV